MFLVCKETNLDNELDYIHRIAYNNSFMIQLINK